MVFRGTITIEWNGCRQSLEMMVFRWFLGQATIGNDGFRWLSTIGPTMEWLVGTIVQVYPTSGAPRGLEPTEVFGQTHIILFNKYEC